MSPFATKSLECDSESNQDSLVTDSDVEDTPSINDSSVKEYWLGKKYFKYALATGLVRNTYVDQGPTHLDSKLYLAMTTFDYSGKLYSLRNQIPSQIWRNGPNDRDEFLTTVGAVLCVGDGGLEQTVLRDICQRGGGSEAQTPYNLRREEPKTVDEGNGVAPSGRDVSLLKEHADSVGSLYEHHEQRGPGDGFSSTIRLGGRTWSSEGRSMKIAHQRAAQIACAALGLAKR